MSEKPWPVSKALQVSLGLYGLGVKGKQLWLNRAAFPSPLAPFVKNNNLGFSGENVPLFDLEKAELTPDGIVLGKILQSPEAEPVRHELAGCAAFLFGQHRYIKDDDVIRIAAVGEFGITKLINFS
jgi:hypothetical protein